ncbi:enolase-phosphatase E1-like [Trachinotus anak]|uniref:enolase-phosphatase E1-like n=1 Tax=Trachinotus anak TaxID=443729 RepID=UPI0039F22DFC
MSRERELNKKTRKGKVQNAKQVNKAHLKMSEDRQSTSSRVMDEEMSDMDNMADTFVSDIMGQAAMNVNELMQSIHRWDSVARAMSEGKNKTSAGSYTEQKVQQHLEKFFTMRRVFAEHRGDVPEEEEAINATAACAQDEDVMSLQLTELANKPRKPLAKRLFKNMKLAWKSHFGKKHSRKNKDGSKEKEEEDMIEEEIGESTSSASTSFSLSPSQVNEVGQPKGQPLAKTLTDEEQMRHDEVLRAATDTKGERSVPDLAESCSQAFVKISSPTSMDQTTEVLPINCQKELKKTKADSIQPSNSEKEEDVQETEEVRIPEKTSSSRLSTGSEENVQTASSASSSSATSAIYEEPNMTTSQVVEDVGTLESKTKKTAKEKIFIGLKTAWKKHFGKNISPVPQSHELTPEVRLAEAEDDQVLRAATDTEGEVSISDVADSSSCDFEKISSPTSMDQTIQVSPISGQEDLEETNADGQVIKILVQSDIQEEEEEENKEIEEEKDEEEDVQEIKEVRTPAKTSSSRLSNGSEESVETTSSASSSSTKSAIYEEPNITTSQVVEDDRTLESKTKKPAKKKFFKGLKTAWKKHFGKNISPVPQSHELTPEVRLAEAEDDQVLRAATDTEGEVSISDVADSSSCAFEKISSPTSMDQTIQVSPISGQEDFEETNADGQVIKILVQSDIQEEEEEEEKDEEDVQEIEEVRTPVKTSSSRLTTGSEESVETASSASSSSTTSAIYEEPNMTTSQVVEDVGTLESKTKKPAKKKIFKGLKTAWKKHFGKNISPVPQSHELTPEVRLAEAEDDQVLRAATDTEGEVSISDVADSSSCAFEKISSPTSMDQTIQVSPIIGQEDFEETNADGQVIKILVQSDIQEEEEEEEEEASSASSSSTTSAIYEEPNMTISQVVEDIRILEFKTKKPAKKNVFKRLQTAWKKRFSKSIAPVPQSYKVTPEVRPVQSDIEDGEDVQEIGSCPKVLTRSQASDEVENISPVSPSHEDEAATSAEDDQIMEIHLQPGPSEEDGRTVCCQERHESTADQMSTISTMTTIITRFFHSLSDEQWREVSEGVYNRGVKDKLIDLCVDVLKFIADSVIKIILESIGQLSTTSCISNLKYPISSEHLLEIFNCDIQRSLENSFSRAVCNTIGADIPASISPEFTEGITTEAFVLVNPVLSMAIQASMDQGSSRAIAPARSQVAKDRAAKTLAGAISTMKSILTGRGNAVKKRIMTQKASETNNEEETPGTTRGGNNWKTEPVWRCFSARQRRQVIPVPLQDLSGSSSSPQSKKKSRSPLATSSTTEDPPQNKATTDEVCNIISKKTEKKNEEKRKTKRALWMRLFCCCSLEE